MNLLIGRVKDRENSDDSIDEANNMMDATFINIAEDLELAGLVWVPEIGDEVFDKCGSRIVSVLVDPQGLPTSELRTSFLWLPTVEQMIFQCEARRSILLHTGLELTDNTMCYKTVLKAPFGPIESQANSIRTSVGLALRELLLGEQQVVIN